MKNIAIFPNIERDKDLKATKEIINVIKKYDKSVLLDESFRDKIECDATFLDMPEIMKRADVIIALGGDGTILKIIKDAAEGNVPVMGINLGHLGFLTQAEKNDLSVFEKLFRGEYSVSNNMMLEARVIRDGAEISRCLALNDVILRGSASKMISVGAEVNGVLANQYLADGMIVATATGSTAYSLSCGGPIVNPELDCMVLTPICPHSLKSRCMVIPPDNVVRIKISPEYGNEAVLRADGNLIGSLNCGDVLEVVSAQMRAPLINVDGRNYFDVIRKKLAD